VPAAVRMRHKAGLDNAVSYGNILYG